MNTQSANLQLHVNSFGELTKYPTQREAGHKYVGITYKQTSRNKTFRKVTIIRTCTLINKWRLIVMYCYCDIVRGLSFWYLQLLLGVINVSFMLIFSFSHTRFLSLKPLSDEWVQMLQTYNSNTTLFMSDNMGLFTRNAHRGLHMRRSSKETDS